MSIDHIQQWISEIWGSHNAAAKRSKYCGRWVRNSHHFEVSWCFHHQHQAVQEEWPCMKIHVVHFALSVFLFNYIVFQYINELPSRIYPSGSTVLLHPRLQYTILADDTAGKHTPTLRPPPKVTSTLSTRRSSHHYHPLPACHRVLSPPSS